MAKSPLGRLLGGDFCPDQPVWADPPFASLARRGAAHVRFLLAIARPARLRSGYPVGKWRRPSVRWPMTRALDIFYGVRG